MNNAGQTLVQWGKYLDAVNDCRPIAAGGRIERVTGILAEASGPGLSVGSLCRITDPGGRSIQAEVIGFNEGRVLLMPFGEMRGIGPGSKVVDIGNESTLSVGDAYLGRVINGLGQPIDGKGPISARKSAPIYGDIQNPLSRRIISQPVDVGVRAINALLTVGKGQRIAVMAGSGVGKSVLMGMIARNTSADVSVIALIGERGREVKEFIERSLGEDGLKKSVVVAATSDAPALVRIKAAYVATTLAEYFRDGGADVLLMMDSITRYAMSQREVGLAAGEPPSSKGYTPGVFAQLPKLLERTGTTAGDGSITGVYTVLVEGDDMNDPIGDAVRSIVDGHIVLSRELAHRGHFPAIDVMQSTSRVMNDIVDEAHLANARKLIEVLATYRGAEDLINIGAYKTGSDAGIDYAQKKINKINAFLQQRINERATFDHSREQLRALLGD